MQAWTQFVKKQEKEIGAETVNKWLNTLRVIKFDACNIYLEAKDSFQKLWVSEHIIPIASKTLLNNNGHKIKIHLSSLDDSPITDSKKESKETSLTFTQSELSPLATLEEYSPTKKNTIPYKLICKLCQYDPLTKTYTSKESQNIFNPLYLYGPTGTGKSHLLMAITSALKIQGRSPLYIKAESFTHHVVQAIRLGRMQEFRNFYRKTDCLIIDDIEILAGKAATQEEFFHTFNTLHMDGIQIILSAKSIPNQLERIEKRLISRFEWGLTLPLIEEKDTEQLVEVCKNRLKFYKLHTELPVNQFLTKKFNSISILASAIDLIAKQFNATNVPYLNTIKLADIQDTLNDFIEKQKATLLDEHALVKIIANVFGIKTSDLLGKSQAREATLPRQIAMYYLRKNFELSLLQIGRFFSRDHSTVISSIRQIEKALSEKKDNVTYYILDIQKKISNYNHQETS